MQPDERRIAAFFDKSAPRYDQAMTRIERWLFGDAREWVVGQAGGEVVELGVGTGLNLPRYPAAVRRVVGVDLSEGMLAVARSRSDVTGAFDVDLRHGDVQTLDLPDGCADTVVSTFTFCTIPDPGAASREAYRVLRPGGAFVLAEHGPTTGAIGRLLQRLLEPLMLRFCADHLLRDPVPSVLGAGFVIESVERGGLGGNTFRVRAHKGLTHRG